MDTPVNPDKNRDWGFNGTNEFQWVENVVTSVVLEDGSTPFHDTVIGKHVLGNLRRPYAKLTDLDVECQDRSTIYGMKFGITGDAADPEENMRFFGDWTPSIIAQNMWYRVKCYSPDHYGPELYQDSFPFGASGTTIIDNVDWSDDLGGSTVLSQLKEASINAGNRLQVRVALFYYTRNLPSYIAYNATLGYVVGSIGVPTSGETHNVAGQRILNPMPNVPVGLGPFPVDDLCHGQDLAAAPYNPWVGRTPFEVDTEAQEVRVDLSNSLPVNFENHLRDIGLLKLGILVGTGETQCVQLIGEETETIPYLTDYWLENESGIYTTALTDGESDLLATSKLVLVQLVEGDEGSSSLCTGFLTVEETHSVQILAEESPYFIRPADYYVGRLSSGDSSEKTFYVTHFGVPADEVEVQVQISNDNALPANGVVPYESSKTTNSSGYVSFDFSISGTIPYPRRYTDPPCEVEDGDTRRWLPIDGQVYYFEYTVCPSSVCQPFETTYAPVFLAFSDVTAQPPYNWVDHIEPILSQYAQLVPIMGRILNMGSYEEVIHYKELMILSLTRPFEDAAYMPTTRDLSPAKRQMILEWLSYDVPQYDSKGSKAPAGKPNVCIAPAVESFKPTSTATLYPRCETSLSFEDHPSKLEPFFQSISNLSIPIVEAKFSNVKKNQGRPLLGLLKAIRNMRTKTEGGPPPEFYCTLPNLKWQLQTAITLEFATLPVYLTSLYSIIDGCNLEIEAIIRSIVMQEMLHMTQAANTLIALGGSPQIDCAECVPSYPTRLPGDVLPALLVSLKKLSIEHVYDTFMAIEVPQITLVGSPPIYDPELATIGAFYDEISNCIEFLDEQGHDLFDPSTVSSQVEWPWNPDSELGNVVPVVNVSTALEGIDVITSQGEGAGIVRPNDIEGNSLAHFFKFEEIVCENKLELNDLRYSYSGPAIHFNPHGVWNMRDNPSPLGIPRHSNCYTEARAFHGAFRNMLRSLQETFNGSPKKIYKAVEVMESLHVHAKKTMWTKLRPNSDDERTCGPVWNYEWPEYEPILK